MRHTRWSPNHRGYAEGYSVIKNARFLELLFLIVWNSCVIFHLAFILAGREQRVQMIDCDNGRRHGAGRSHETIFWFSE